MRLIDADALIERIEKNICEPCKKRKEDYNGVRCRACQYGDEIDDIEDAPTIEGRKTGEWSPHPNKEFREWDVCSSCGIGCKRREYGIEENGQEWVTEYNYPYCPNCGADMRGEEHAT